MANRSTIPPNLILAFLTEKIEMSKLIKDRSSDFVLFDLFALIGTGLGLILVGAFVLKLISVIENMLIIILILKLQIYVKTRKH